ncbi:MAG: heparan-alpha-glucosaminide N-acetyltransferase domain-containing protein [Acidobacteriia bacterium]|nr:heparan-alpha-glucosaminide N-acetyltransferase domain-containing protein [Terriglobia bacterium]
MAQPEKTSFRLPQFDWMRGLACLFMFERHTYDSWLLPSVRGTTFFHWSELIASMAAPSFLFLAGLSTVLIVKKSSEEGMVSRKAATRIFRRGAEILGLALIFRIVDLGLWLPDVTRPHWWLDLMRVDVLNVIGVSLMMVGAVCWVAGTQARAALVAALAGAFIVAGTPLVWSVWRPTWLPWPLESYFDGVHNTGTPQAYLFPIFPWAGFTFAGFVAGYLLLSAWARRNGFRLIWMIAGSGIFLALLGRALDHSSVQLYSYYDFWHSSPNYFMIRLGMLLIILSLCYLRCRFGESGLKNSPLITLGQHSLMVYWVHIEFVYGRFCILKRQGMGILGATLGLIGITVAMYLLALYYGRWETARRKRMLATTA